MNPIKKFDLKAIAACAAVFAIVQGLLFGDIIGPFWELNIILICINIILATSLNRSVFYRSCRLHGSRCLHQCDYDR